jgi:DNA-binding winged helix-turn-helix (wHTH) protein
MGMSLSDADTFLPPTARAGANGYEAAAVGVAPMAHVFAGFRFDADIGLERHGARIPLPPTESRMLALLLEAGGRIVRKNELAERVWCGAPASDNSISRAICAIRRTLRRYTDEQVVETVYGVGFRITVPVEFATPPWPAQSVLGVRIPQTAALACLQVARDLLRGGRPADVPHAAAAVDRAVRLLCGDDRHRAEPAT